MIAKRKNLFSKAALPALAIILGLGLNSAEGMEPDAEKKAHTKVVKFVEMEDLRSYAEVSKGLHKIVLKKCKKRLFTDASGEYNPGLGLYIYGSRVLGYNWIGAYLMPFDDRVAGKFMYKEEMEDAFKFRLLALNQK